MFKKGSYTVSVSHEPSSTRMIGYSISNTYIDHMEEVKGQANNLRATSDVANGQSSCSYCRRPICGRLPVPCKGISLPCVDIRKAGDPHLPSLRSKTLLASTARSTRTLIARGRCGLASRNDGLRRRVSARLGVVVEARLAVRFERQKYV